MESIRNTKQEEEKGENTNKQINNFLKVKRERSEEHYSTSDGSNKDNNLPNSMNTKNIRSIEIDLENDDKTTNTSHSQIQTEAKNGFKKNSKPTKKNKIQNVKSRPITDLPNLHNLENNSNINSNLASNINKEELVINKIDSKMGLKRIKTQEEFALESKSQKQKLFSGIQYTSIFSSIFSGTTNEDLNTHINFYLLQSGLDTQIKLFILDFLISANVFITNKINYILLQNEIKIKFGENISKDILIFYVEYTMLRIKTNFMMNSSNNGQINKNNFKNGSFKENIFEKSKEIDDEVDKVDYSEHAIVYKLKQLKYIIAKKTVSIVKSKMIKNIDQYKFNFFTKKKNNLNMEYESNAIYNIINNKWKDNVIYQVNNKEIINLIQELKQVDNTNTNTNTNKMNENNNDISFYNSPKTNYRLGWHLIEKIWYCMRKLPQLR